MRVCAACLIGSVVVAPMDCGPSSDSPVRQENRKATVAEKRGRSSKPGLPAAYVEPLVSAIDVGGNSLGPHGTDRAHSTSFIRFDAIAPDEFDFTSDDRAAFDPHGEQVYASGCAASRHPTSRLTKARFQELLQRFAQQPMSSESEALEELLYFGRQTTSWINRQGTAPLDSERAGFLRKELGRTHVLVSFRIVDEQGVVRTHMPPTRVPLDRRHVFDMDVKDLPPLITSGTVKRVGLHHLWTRL